MYYILLDIRIGIRVSKKLFFWLVSTADVFKGSFEINKFLQNKRAVK